ncbi:protein yellow-like isoform X2 [Wyeomyia smithii]|uniref:protein yellow-like isoform X2 n=1 Tax=Wyeomyia smithii TaxID=174621 RepID=UPI0024681022|nr:protein yellow-like isoform X2 [Wyeomyia smithii]
MKECDKCDHDGSCARTAPGRGKFATTRTTEGMMQKWIPPTAAGLWLLLAFFAFVDGYSPFMKVRHGTIDISGSAQNSSPIVANPYFAPLVTLKNKNDKNEFDTSEGKDIFEVIYQWKIIDFLYPSLQARNNAIRTRAFIPDNNLPLGVDRFRNRIFITTPRWNPGVPATLSYLPLPVENPSAPLNPYPNWSFHTTPQNPDCSKLVSVYRLYVDECDRLWVIDAGVIDTLTNLQQICPPKVLAFDLLTDKLLFTYELPPEQVKQDSLHTNLAVDIRDGKCDDAFIYVADVWRYGITVISLREGKSWRTTNYLYNPNPFASDYNYLDLNFQWSDGVFGLSLSPVHSNGDRMVFYHPMSSYTEFQVPASVLQNETIWQNFGLAKAFQPLGSRGKGGQSSTSGVSTNKVQFFTLVQQSGVGCWDLAKPYNRNNLGIVEKNLDKLTFPNDLKLDREPKQSIWVISNKLPVFLYSRLNYSETNFRVLQAEVQSAVLDTVCDPRVAPNLAYKPEPDCDL